MTQRSFSIHPITRAEAKQILSWRYDAPYDFYNPPEPDDPNPYVEKFLAPERAFHSVRGEQNRFVGFCSFGEDGQVLGGSYPDGPLDIGLGMKPTETSRGYGRAFFQTIVDFAQQQFKANSLRLSVASFNHRAIKVYRYLGFETTSEFVEIPGDTPYLIMERPYD